MEKTHHVLPPPWYLCIFVREWRSSVVLWLPEMSPVDPELQGLYWALLGTPPPTPPYFGPSKLSLAWWAVPAGHVGGSAEVSPALCWLILLMGIVQTLGHRIFLQGIVGGTAGSKALIAGKYLCLLGLEASSPGLY